MAGIWNIPDDEPQGLLGGLQRGFTNPMTLAGLGLLSGGGWDAAGQGMRMGMGFDEQRRQDAARQQFQGLLQDPSVTSALPAPMLRVAQMAGPSGGPELLAKYLDPAREADLAYKKALTEKAMREAAGGSSKYGKTGAVFQGPDGNFYTMQFAEDGTRKVEPVQYPGQNGSAPVPLTPARGVMEVGDTLVDRSTGGVVRNTGDNLEEAKRRETLGKERAEVAATLPAAEMASQRALDTVEAIRKHPGKRWGVGVSGVLPGIPGTDQKGFVTLVDQAKGQAFLEAFNSLRGGGQITEAEGRKATDALARLDRSQTQTDFDAALNDYEEVIRNGLAAVRRKAGAAPKTTDDGWTDVGGIRIREKQ